MKSIVTNRFSSERRNDGVKDRQEEISSVARTNLLSTDSFSFDYEDGE